jgi:hypothetical protein
MLGLAKDIQQAWPSPSDMNNAARVWTQFMSLCQTHAATQCKQAAQDKDTSVASVLGQQPLFAFASRCPPQLLLLEYLLQRVSYDLLGALEETFHMDTWPSCLHSYQRPSRHCPYELSRTLGSSPLTQHAAPEVLCVTNHPMLRTGKATVWSGTPHQQNNTAAMHWR